MKQKGTAQAVSFLLQKPPSHNPPVACPASGRKRCASLQARFCFSPTLFSPPSAMHLVAKHFIFRRKKKAPAHANHGHFNQFHHRMKKVSIYCMACPTYMWTY